jgi:preprotein translocase subunit SecD
MREKRISNLNEDARQTLSEAQIAVAGIARDGNGVVVTLSNPAQMEPALTAMRALLGGGMAVAVDRTVVRQGDNAIRYAFTDAAVTAMASRPDASALASALLGGTPFEIKYSLTSE